MEQRMCDLCGSSDNSIFMRMEDHCTKVPGVFTITRCTACGLLYTNPLPTKEVLHSLYDLHYQAPGAATMGPTDNRSKKTPVLRMFWHRFCGQYISEVVMKSSGHVLDVGCGRGDLMGELRDAGCSVSGVEPNSSSARAAREKGFAVYEGSFEQFPIPEKPFDVLIFWHALEHMPSPKASLLKARRMLGPHGRVFIWCPNAGSYLAHTFNEFWRGWHLPFHFYHFTDETIKKLAQDTGFTIKKIKAVTVEYITLHSMQILLDNRGSVFLKHVLDSRFFRSVLFRGVLSSLYRVLDFLMPGKGEFLQVELRAGPGNSDPPAG